jgi:hypothetical protein
VKATHPEKSTRMEHPRINVLGREEDKKDETL